MICVTRLKSICQQLQLQIEVCRLCKVSQLQLVMHVALFRVVQQKLPGPIYEHICMQIAFELERRASHALPIGQVLRPQKHMLADIIPVPVQAE